MNTIKNIKGEILNTSLDRLVLKKIGNSTTAYPFISKSSKDSIKLYIKGKNKDKDIKVSKELWKNLLIDAICILKINDSRERIYKDCENNKDLFIEKFDTIRKSSSYGIDEIGKYFDDFIEFESVLYGTDEHYRDHVGHVIQVWAIGISLISNYEIIFSDKYIVDRDHDFHFEIRNDSPSFKMDPEAHKEYISKSELWAMWTIIALCHDLGYPIEKTSKINIQAKKIISHFGNMNFSELNYSFDIFNTFLVNTFLNVISSKAIIKSNQISIQTKYKDKLSKSLEDYKHGIFSSLLLFKNFTYFLETDFTSENANLSEEDLRQFHIRKEILRAIAGHTCPKIYHLELNTLSFLLILCDELQEWNRPKFEEFKYNTKVDEPNVEITEFSMKGEQKISIKLEYSNDFDDKYMKHLVENRFKNIHNLLRSAKDDGKRKTRKIVFNWDINFNNVKFSLNFDSNRDSFDLMEISRYNKIDKENWSNKINIELYEPLKNISIN